MSGWGQRALIAAAAVVVAAACIELGGPRVGVISISSLDLPYPAVVLGDILRDSLGNPAPLSITAFDNAGNPIVGEPVAFVALDTTISVDADGTVHGLFRDSIGGRVVAGAGSLQTAPARIIVTARPVAVTAPDVTAGITFDLLTPDSTTQTNWSPPLTLTVTGAGAVPVQGFIVTYQIIRSPAARAAVPTAYLGEDANNKSFRDTTDLRGGASRRVILRQVEITDADLSAGAKTDTITVRASVTHLGVDLAGSPADFFIPVKRKP